MSEFKMSDAFSLPISGDSIEFYCKNSKGGSFDFDENCVAHAINSHDNLVEQNQMLREALKRISEWDNMSQEFRLDHGSKGQQRVIVDIATKALEQSKS